MSLAFLILAHRQPALVARLFAALNHPEDTFVLHFDRRAPEDLHRLGRELARQHPNVIVLPSRPIVWGGPAMAEVQIEAMTAARKHSTAWSHFINLTGQDFPLVPRHEIIGRLKPGTTYLGWFNPLNDHLWSDARERLSRRYLPWLWLQRALALPAIGHRLRYALGWRNRLPSIPGFKRRWPGFFRYFGGPNHGIFSREATAYLAEDPRAQRIRRWLQGSAHSDEIVFQSVLLNSPLSSAITNDSLREIDFPRDAPHPRTFTSTDLPRLRASPALFARKFDLTVDPAVLAALEAHRAPSLSP